MHTSGVSRRTFLKDTFLGAFFLSLGGMLAPFWRLSVSPAVPDHLQFLSPDEFVLLRAIAERLIGLEAGKEAVPESVMIEADRYLAAEDRRSQEEFHQLLSVFGSPLFTFLFDFRFSGFLSMSPSDQETYLEDWMTSSFAFRRRAFQALKRLCLSRYYLESDHWQEIGYEGMFLPEDRK